MRQKYRIILVLTIFLVFLVLYFFLINLLANYFFSSAMQYFQEQERASYIDYYKNLTKNLNSSNIYISENQSVEEVLNNLQNSSNYNTNKIDTFGMSEYSSASIIRNGLFYKIYEGEPTINNKLTAWIYIFNSIKLPGQVVFNFYNIHAISFSVWFAFLLFYLVMEIFIYYNKLNIVPEKIENEQIS